VANLGKVQHHPFIFLYDKSHHQQAMPPLTRILIKTHHMTSRKKILTITKAAKRLSCSVLLKTGGPPGVMIAEGELAGDWLEVVRVSMIFYFHSI